MSRFALALVLAGWVAPALAEGPLPVFSDQVAFAIDAPGPEQRQSGFFGGGSISGLYGGEHAGQMLMVTPPGDAVVGRRIDRPLAGLPKLVWNWRRFDPRDGQAETLTDDSPMRIIVGFTGGAPTAPPSDLPHAKPSELPPFDRALVVVWANAPWESGAADRRGQVARFIAHGGPADGRWWEQSIDLAGLHARLWPDAVGAEVRVAWVAVGVRASDGRSAGEVSGLTLLP